MPPVMQVIISQVLRYMADNYLEKRFAEVFGPDAKKKTVVRRTNPSLDTLLRRNRSVRGYDPARHVTEEELRAIIAVNPLIASSKNRQALRFRIVTEGWESVGRHCGYGAHLPELHLPFPGTEPQAFIVVCSQVPEDVGLGIDLGISLQSMLLKAVEMGLNGLMIRSFRRDKLRESLSLPLEPVAVLAIGKSAESIYLKPVAAGESLIYYRKEGVHYVPKLGVDDLLV